VGRREKGRIGRYREAGMVKMGKREGWREGGRIRRRERNKKYHSEGWPHEGGEELSGTGHTFVPGPNLLKSAVRMKGCRVRSRRVVWGQCAQVDSIHCMRSGWYAGKVCTRGNTVHCLPLSASPREKWSSGQGTHWGREVSGRVRGGGRWR